MAQRESELRRSKSWREGGHRKTPSRVRSPGTTSNSRLTIKSLSDLDDLSEEFYEFVPCVDTGTDSAFMESVTGSENKPLGTKRVDKFVANFTDECNEDAVTKDTLDGKPTQTAWTDDAKFRNTKTPETATSRSDKSGLTKSSLVNEYNIDKMTDDNEEVVKLGNTQQRPRGGGKPKRSVSVGEGKLPQKIGSVQLRRCLSLYDRKRNPHFCKEHTASANKDNKPVRDSGFTCVANGNSVKKAKTMPVTDGRITPVKTTWTNRQRQRMTPDKVNTTHGITAGRRSPNCQKVRKLTKSIASPRDDVHYSKTNMESEKANGTSRSRGSSILSRGSDSSSELEFDSLVPLKLGSANSGSKSPARQPSLIPRPVRTRSTTLCLGEEVINGYLNNGLKSFRQDKNSLKRSTSWYEKKVSASHNGTEVCIKIRESVASVSSSESSFSSLDNVFSSKSTSTASQIVDVPEDEDGYPEPVPPSTSRSDVFNPREYLLVDDHALKAPESLRNSFEDLLSYLLADLSSDLSRVRAIYRWIVSQTIPLTLTRHDFPEESPLGFLYNIREKRATYSELLAVMCRKSGIHCVIIHGVAKGLAYGVGDKISYKKMKNNWNAVYIDGGWRFIHPYWASQAPNGYCTGRWAVAESDNIHTEDEEDFHSDRAPVLNDFYFLTDPDKFITKCFPDDPQWQLQRKHITQTEFESLPFLQPAFYELRLKTKSHNECVIHTEHGKVDIMVEIPKEKTELYKFRHTLHVQRDWEAEGEYDGIRLDRYLLYYHEENVAHFEIRFPLSGIFKLELHCSDPRNPLPSTWVCDYKIICKTPMEFCNPLPVIPVIGWGAGDEVKNAGLECLTHRHTKVSLDKETVTFVRFALPKDKEISLEAELLHNDKSASELQSHVVTDQDGEHATFQISPPSEGEYAFRVYARPKSGEQRENVCNFLMYRTKIIEDPELSDIRQSLLRATEDGDVDTLAYWVEKFHEKGMADRGDLTAAKKKLHLAKLNRDIAEAIARKDLDLLERTMNSISGTSLKKQLSHVTAEAEAMRSRLRRLKRLRHAVLEMDQKTISEMRSYPKPPPAVHGVMAATFMLLGNKESDLKKWTRIQGLISKRGKDGLKRRVAEFNSTTVSAAVLKRVMNILNKYDLEAVQIASAGAATFYQWACTMAGEVENDMAKAY